MQPSRFVPRWSLSLALILVACQDRSTAPPLSLAPKQAQRERAEGYTATGELRAGWITGRNGAPMKITYEVIHGLAVWEGDIILGRASEMPTSPRALAELRSQGVRANGVVIDGDGFRWPGGIVPYVIDGGLPNQSRATDAMLQLEQETNGVHFVPRSSEDNYVRFVTSDGCSSEIGMIGGAQDINLADDCTKGNAMHEITHALGLFHEHTRCDRDTYVQINWDNIIEEKKFNFDKQCDDATDYFDYAEGSIMHYGPTAFSKNGEATIVSLRGLDDLMGQRSAMGETDIATINLLYGANNDAPVASMASLASSYDEGSPVSFDASGSSDVDDATITYSWDFGDGFCDPTPAPAECTAVSPTHTYVDNGSYEVTLTVSDGYASNNTSSTATIVNVAPTVNAGSDATLVSGETLNFSGSFSDPGVIDYPWTWTIDWGFGSNTNGSTNNQGAPILATKQACAAGTYNVVLSVTDKDGGTGADSRTLTVSYYAVSIDISPTMTSPNPISLGKKGVLPVAILSTAAFDATLVDPSTAVLGNEIGTDTPVARQPNGRYQSKMQDINGDGRLDLVVMFNVATMIANGDVTPGTTGLALRAFVSGGCLNIRGADAVKVVP